MIEKDTRYWELHKEIWIKSFDELDKMVQSQVVSNPHCNEAQLLEKRVDSAIQDFLKKGQEVNQV